MASQKSTSANPLSTAWGIIPHFPSTDIPATITFYTEHLHFYLGGVDPDPPAPPHFCSIAGGAPAIRSNIYFFLKKPGEEVRPCTAMIALGTKAVDEYYELLKREGKVEIVDDLADRSWGYRQFTVKDPDGNQLQFFRFIEGGNPGDE